MHLSSMKKRNLKQTAAPLNGIFNDAHNTNYTQLHLIALDIIDSNIFKPLPLVKKKTLPENNCKVCFDNKTIKNN